MGMTTTYAFQTVDLVNIRRFCGYPPRRADGNHILFGSLYNADGELEYVLTQMLPEEGTMIMKIVADLITLESALMTATDNMDTDQAGIWKHNKTEMVERENFFTSKRLYLCNMIGMRPGPFLNNNSSRWVV